jgi:F-type H+-transporting ATPase subunit alpha
MVELLKQPQYQPLEVEDQILVIYAAGQGYLDDLPLARVADFEKGLIADLRDAHPEMVKRLRETQDLSEPAVKELEQALRDFKARFVKPKDAPAQEQK